MKLKNESLLLEYLRLGNFAFRMGIGPDAIMSDRAMHMAAPTQSTYHFALIWAKLLQERFGRGILLPSAGIECFEKARDCFPNITKLEFDQVVDLLNEYWHWGADLRVWLQGQTITFPRREVPAFEGAQAKQEKPNG